MHFVIMSHADGREIEWECDNRERATELARSVVNLPDCVGAHYVYRIGA